MIFSLLFIAFSTLLVLVLGIRTSAPQATRQPAMRCPDCQAAFAHLAMHHVERVEPFWNAVEEVE
jgi:hypothetical protein